MESVVKTNQIISKDNKKAPLVRFVEWALDKFEKGSTAPVMVDEVAGQLLSDKDLSRQFNEHMRKGDTVFTVQNKEKKFTVNIIK